MEEIEKINEENTTETCEKKEKNAIAICAAG